ncbi:protein FAM13A [Pelomyxa schiedti]|nr:protein FAM13A [Pelomyxa schiedti]
MLEWLRSGGTSTAAVAATPVAPLQEKVIIIPAVFYKLCLILLERGLETEGIFRVSGDQGLIKGICKNFSECSSTDNVSRMDVHNIAGIIKYYIRNNVEPLIPQPLYHKFISAQKDGNISLLKQAVSELPTVNRLLLHCLFDLLYHVAEHAEQNKMDSANLGVVFGPTIMFNAEEIDLSLSLQYNKLQCELVVTLIHHYMEIFPEPVVPEEYLALNNPPIAEELTEFTVISSSSPPTTPISSAPSPSQNKFQFFSLWPYSTPKKEPTSGEGGTVLREHKTRQNMFAMLVKKQEEERVQLLAMIDTLQKKVSELEHQTKTASTTCADPSDQFRDIAETMDAVKSCLSVPLAEAIVPEADVRTQPNLSTSNPAEIQVDNPEESNTTIGYNTSTTLIDNDPLITPELPAQTTPQPQSAQTTPLQNYPSYPMPALVDSFMKQIKEQLAAQQQEIKQLREQNTCLRAQLAASQQGVAPFAAKTSESDHINKLESSIEQLQEQLDAEVHGHNATRLLLRTEQEQAKQREATISKDIIDLKKQCFSATLLSVKMNVMSQSKHLVGFPSVHDLFEEALRLNVPFQDYGKFICEKVLPPKSTE